MFGRLAKRYPAMHMSAVVAIWRPDGKKLPATLLMHHRKKFLKLKDAINPAPVS